MTKKLSTLLISCCSLTLLAGSITLSPPAFAVLPSLIDASADLLVETTPPDEQAIDNTTPNLELIPYITDTDRSQNVHTTVEDIKADVVNTSSEKITNPDDVSGYVDILLLGTEESSSVTTEPLPPEPASSDEEPATIAETNTEDKTKADTADEKIIALASESSSKANDLQQALSELKPETQAGLEELTKALHTEHRTIAQELQDEAELSLSDLGLLWQAAVERSGTIRFAIEKLSRRSATGKVDDEHGFTKRVVQSMAKLGGVAGSMWTGTPAGVMSGSLVNQLISGAPDNTSVISKVTDADMLILAKEVEALQTEVIQGYYQYKHTRELWKLSQKGKREVALFYDNLDTSASEAQALLPVLESLMSSISQEESEYRQNFVSARNNLSLLVGADAIIALEKSTQ